MARPARSAGNDFMVRSDPVRTLLLQALHQGAALRGYLHQQKEDLQNAAGVRMLNKIRNFFTGEPGLGRDSLGAIYAKVGAFIGAYSLTVYLVTQGGIGLGLQPGLDAKAKITSAYNAIFVIGFGILIVAIAGAAYTRTRREYNDLPLPLPWPAKPTFGRNGPIGWTIMLAGLFWCVLGPALVLYHVNKKVQNEGYLWQEGTPPSSVLEPVCVYGALLPIGRCSMVHNKARYAERLMAPSEAVWLTNNRCDALWWKTDGEPTPEAREHVSSLCQRPKDTNAEDRSDLCKSDQRKCRGSQWIQVAGVPLILLPTFLAGAGVLWLLIAWRLGPLIVSDGD